MLHSRRSLRLAALTVAAVLGLAACGGGSPSGGGGGGGGGAEFSTIQSGTLTIGSDIPYPPFEMQQGGSVTGFDVEIMNQIAKGLGLKPKWLNTNFDTIFTSLAAGKFDVVASAVTAYAPKGSPAYSTVQQRSKIVDFSKPYYPSLQSLTVDTEANPNIKTVDDLSSGDKVGVQRGTTGAYYAEKALGGKGVELVTYVKAPDIFTAIQSGQLDAGVVDLPVALDAIKSKPGLQVVQQIDTGEQYAFAVNKNNPGLRDAINQQLQKMFKDGSYAKVYKKYFPQQELPSYAQP